MKNKCPFEESIIQAVVMKTAPICFHCGSNYVRDIKHCGNTHNTWKPICNCLTTSAIRIVTGSISNDVDEDYEEWEE